MAKLKLTAFVQKLHQLIIIKVMDIFFINIVSGNIFRSTVSSSITIYWSNIGVCFEVTLLKFTAK